MTEQRLTQLVVTPAQIRSLIGLPKQTVRNRMIAALHASGFDVHDLKAIQWQRTPNDGCVFRGPTRT